MKKEKQLSTLQRLGDNFVSLVILQVVNSLLPLFLIPYLLRTIGVENFGIFSFIMAIMMYGVKMSDYGFDLSATYHISLHREDSSKVSEIFSSVLTIKLLIATAYTIALVMLLFFVDKLYIYKELIALSFGILFGFVLNPIWLFQGMERMRYIMYFNGLSKLLFFVLVLLFVKSESDLYKLLLLNSLSTLLIGATALFIGMRSFHLKFSLQPKSRLLFYLKDSWYIFTSKFAVEFYTTLNIIILGFFVTPLVMGYYAVSVKIIHAIGNLLEPLTRTVYPYLVKLYQSSKEEYVRRNIQLAIVIFLVMLPITFSVWYFAEDILRIITGDKVARLNIEILQLFAISLIVYLYGTQFTNILVTIKETKVLNKILFLSAGVNILLSPILVYFFGVMGMVTLSVFIAFFMMALKAYYLFNFFIYNSTSCQA